MWRVRVWHGGKFIHAGSHATREQAVRAYDAKAKQLKGASAVLNFPDGDEEEEAAAVQDDDEDKEEDEGWRQTPAPADASAEQAAGEADHACPNCKRKFPSKAALAPHMARWCKATLAQQQRRKAGTDAVGSRSHTRPVTNVTWTPGWHCCEGGNVGDALVGRRVAAWWPEHSQYYEADVRAFDAGSGAHTLRFVSDGLECDWVMTAHDWHLAMPKREAAPGATHHEHVNTAEPAVGRCGGGAMPHCAEPQAKRARHVEGEGAGGKQLATSNAGAKTALLLRQKQVQQRPGTRTSRFRGISWHKGAEKWRVRVFHEGKTVHLPLVEKDEEDAARAYDALARSLKGSSATLNFPGGSEIPAATQGAACSKRTGCCGGSAAQYTRMALGSPTPASFVQKGDRVRYCLPDNAVAEGTVANDGYAYRNVHFDDGRHLKLKLSGSDGRHRGARFRDQLEPHEWCFCDLPSWSSGTGTGKSIINNQ